MQFCLISLFTSFLFLCSAFVFAFSVFFLDKSESDCIFTAAPVPFPLFTTELITHLFSPLLLKSSKTPITPPCPSFVNNPHLIPLRFTSVSISPTSLKIRSLLLDGPLGQIRIMAPSLNTMFHQVLCYPLKSTPELLNNPPARQKTEGKNRNKAVTCSHTTPCHKQPGLMPCLISRAIWNVYNFQFRASPPVNKNEFQTFISDRLHVALIKAL